MSNRSSHQSWARRVLAGVGVLSLLLAVGGSATAVSTGPAGKFGRATVNTRSAWDGKYHIEGFDLDHVATVGEVITVPQDVTDLVAFRFYLCTYDADTSRTLRGEVYAWDGTKATGAAVWEGAAKTFTGLRHCRTQRVTFDVGGVHLSPGAQYVIFMTLSKDDEQPSGGVWAYGALRDDSSYPGGSNYDLVDHGDESLWTTHAWIPDALDMAMKVWLRPHSDV